MARSLQLLNMNDNPIPKIEADSFPRLSNLMELHLSGLRTLKKITAKSFLPLVNLKILVCNFNHQLEIIDSDAFAGLQTKLNLKEVSLIIEKPLFVVDKSTTSQMMFLNLVLAENKREKKMIRVNRHTF